MSDSEEAISSPRMAVAFRFSLTSSGKNQDVTIQRPNNESAVVTYKPSAANQKEGVLVVMYDVSRNVDAGDVLVIRCLHSLFI